MKRCLIATTLLLLASLLSACSGNNSPGNSSKPAEKMAAPSISVVSLDGEQLKTESLKGKVVMLNFWATWCPPCREEIPSMIKLEKFMSGKPFQMVCVSVDKGGKKAVTEFFRNTGYSLPAYTDSTSQAAAVYGITGVPETFIIDKKGMIVKKVIGPMDWSSPEVIAFIEGLLSR